MRRVRITHYIFAGLDFIFDKHERPWFLEANYAPHMLTSFKKLYGEALPVKKLADFINRKEWKDVCVISSRKDIFSNNIENSLWFANELKRYLKNKNLHICYEEENKKRYRKLKNNKKQLITPDVILRWNHWISSSFENRGVCVINPNIVKETVHNKFYTASIVKTSTKVNTPETFLVKNKKELVEILKKKPEKFDKGFVIKPIEGSHGYHVHVLTMREHIPSISEPELLEQRIIPKLTHRKYWDVRVFVVNGEVVGGIKKETIHRVTNIARGGKPYPLEKRLLKKLVKPSLDVVKAIDREIESSK